MQGYRFGILALVSLFVASLALGCHSRRGREGGDGDDDDNVDIDPGDDDDPIDDPGDDPVDDPGDDPIDDPVDDPGDDPVDDPGDGDVRGPYPEGPYGYQQGDVIANYRFETTTGSISFNSLRQSREHTILLVYGGSLSCGWCAVEGPEVEGLFPSREGEGLLVLGVVMDNGAGGAPTADDAEYFFTQEHHAEYPYGAAVWEMNQLAIDWAVGGVIGLPVNVIIDLETMEILERIDGYPKPGGIAPIVEGYLPYNM